MINMKTSKKRMFLRAFEDGKGIVTYACKKVCITRQTYYKWLKKDDKFSAQCDEIKENVIDIVESKLLTAINDGDLTAIIFYLKTKGRNRGYVERIENEVSVNPFEELLKSLPDDDE